MIAFLFFSVMFIFACTGMFIKFIVRRVMKEEFKKFGARNITSKKLIKHIDMVKYGAYNN